MAEITAKFVRTLAPGGATLNFTGNTGDSHRAVAMPLSLIEKALKRNIKVYELIEIKDEETEEVTGYKYKELTLENYTEDNGGKAVTESNNVVPDIEKEREETHAAEFAERLAEKGLEIKAKQEAIAASYLGVTYTTATTYTTVTTTETTVTPTTTETTTTTATFDISSVRTEDIPDDFGSMVLTEEEQELANSMKAAGKADDAIMAAIKAKRAES